MYLKGYAIIKSEFTSEDIKNREITSPVNPSDFAGKTVRILEIAQDDSSLLCINRSSTGIADIKMSAIKGWFKCKEEGGILIPYHLKGVEKIIYAHEIREKLKFPYNNFVKSIIISMSLLKGQLDNRIVNH